MKKFLLAACCVFALGACATQAPPTQVLPTITFQHLAPLTLGGQSLTIKDVRIKPTTGRDVSLRFPTPPEQALRTWAQQRLSLQGGADQLAFTIIDAVAIEEPLKTQDGIKGLFTTSQSERYTVKIAAQLEVISPSGLRQGMASAQANRFITVPEDMTLLEREQAWFTLVEQVMADFDKTMTANIAQKLQ